MEATAYETLAEHEAEGWYYRARIKAVATLIRRFAPAVRGRRIIDIGCGTGGSTETLRAFGEVLGIEPSARARQLAQERFPDLKILPAAIENLPELELGNFDIAVILCVLYHQNIVDPAAALASIAQLQRAGALLIWNEPAYGFLWRQHDRQTAAGRRFQPVAMRDLLEKNGYELVFRSHLLAWGFPIALLLSLLDRWQWGGDRQSTSPEEGADNRPLPGWLNWLLKTLTYGEWSLNLWRLGLPFGVSYLVAARKRA